MSTEEEAVEQPTVDLIRLEDLPEQIQTVQDSTEETIVAIENFGDQFFSAVRDAVNGAEQTFHSALASFKRDIIHKLERTEETHQENMLILADIERFQGMIGALNQSFAM